jgi:hypothetical protein
MENVDPRSACDRTETCSGTFTNPKTVMDEPNRLNDLSDRVEATHVLSKTLTQEPNLTVVLMLNADPKTVLSRTEIVEAHFATDLTENELPSSNSWMREHARPIFNDSTMDTLEPRRHADRTESDDPKCTKFRTLAFDPKLAIDLTDKALDSCCVSRTDAAAPRSVRHNNDSPDPTFTAPLSDKLLPIIPKFKAVKLDPNLPVERTEKHEPMLASPKTLICTPRLVNLILASRQLIELEIFAIARKDSVVPKLEKSNTLTRPSIVLLNRRDREDATLRQSTIEQEYGTFTAPRIETVEPSLHQSITEQVLHEPMCMKSPLTEHVDPILTKLLREQELLIVKKSKTDKVLPKVTAFRTESADPNLAASSTLKVLEH